MNSLTDRARLFIESGAEDQQTLLSDCLAANNIDALRAVQMMAEDMYGGFTYNYELKAAAAICLIRWGEQGLEALIEAAKRTDASKNNSLALEILASVAASADMPQLGQHLLSESLFRFVRDSVSDWQALSASAKNKLQTFVLSFDDDDDVCLAVGLKLHTAPLIGGSAMARELFQAVASRWLAVSQPVLSSYRELMANQPDNEPAFQAFFMRHPQLLDPMVAEVWAQPDIHGAKEPDFVIRRTDNTYLVVEIETPSKLLVTSARQLSAEATHAVTQAVDYAQFLSDRLLEASATFPGFQTPDSLAVVGLEGALSPSQARALRLENGSRHHLRIVGFDWLLRRAEAIATNTITQRVPVHRARII